MLPGLLPAFQTAYPQVHLTLHNTNSERITEALLRSELDLGFMEGRTKSQDLHHELLLPDELVAVRHATHGPPTPLALAEALAHPLVLRERGSGTLKILEFALRTQQIKLSSLPVAIYLGNTEAIKGYLEATPAALDFVSRRALGRELTAGPLEIVPIEGLHLARQFEARWVQGKVLARPAQQFLSFVQEQSKGSK